MAWRQAPAGQAALENVGDQEEREQLFCFAFREQQSLFSNDLSLPYTPGLPKYISESNPQKVLSEEIECLHDKLSLVSLCKPFYDTRQCSVHPNLEDGEYDFCQWVHSDQMSQQHHEADCERVPCIPWACVSGRTTHQED